MKTFRYLFLVLAFSCVATAYSQDAVFSANTKALMLQLKHLSTLKSSLAQVSAGLKQSYPVRIFDNQIYIGALVKVGPGIDEKALANLGVKINTRISDIWSIMIPLFSLEKLKDVKGLIYVEADCTIKKKLDNATTESRVKLVQAGSGIKRKCLGDSVVVGIVDDGFDYTHPTFYDTTGTKLRIVRSWEQDNTQGPAPSGFSYGTELSTTQALLNKKSSSTSEDHGSHVGGIAGGSGYLTPGLQYMGVAPDADLVFVNTSEAASAITDGINYIFKYAASVGRPAVVNLSLGSHIGPHDGTSLMDQTIDGLVGQGKIVTGAAGNEGDTPLHLAHTFIGDTVKTFMDFEEPNGVKINMGRIDLWGSAGSDLSVSVIITNQQFQVLGSTRFLAASANPQFDSVMMISGDSIRVQVTGVSSSPLNQKPNLLTAVNRVKNKYVVTLVVTSTNTQANLWNHGTGTGASLYDTLNSIKMPGYKAGDNVCTIGEIGGTSKKIITVGAYVTKYQYVNIKGNTMTSSDSLDHLAAFSSRGPTVDGRTKPEITAPGEQLVSSVNSYSPKYDGNYSKTVLKVEKGGSSWYFGAMQGTSMATPMTTGIIALMLQANPKLGPEQVKQILKDGARRDSYTHDIPAEGSNIWGWGKIDAQKAVLAAFSSQGIEGNNATGISAFPNPSTGVVFLKNTVATGQTSEISVRSMLGATVLHQWYTWSSDGLCRLDLNSLPAGMYVIIIVNDLKQQEHLKVLINR
ncbi:MAG: S8 family serine peptidase [Bacteroidota bacterium]|jgi:minor extracellular serine protease Vpr